MKDKTEPVWGCLVEPSAEAAGFELLGQNFRNQLCLFQLMNRVRAG